MTMRRGCLPALVAGLLMLGALGWLLGGWFMSGPLKTPTAFVVPDGSSLGSVAAKLEGEGAIDSASAFRWRARLFGGGAPIKAGEFMLPKGASPSRILSIIQGDEILRRFVTVPEGMPSIMVYERLMAHSGLTGSIAVPPEGSILPDTYEIQRGESRQAVLLRMQAAMQRTLAEAWEKRGPNIAVKTPQEALALAAIVEKETGKPEERRIVAGLYSNRLRQGIMLQADPTIIYPITKGKPLGRRIQIGFDPDTGEELFEEQQLDYQPLPQIVVIVDELADLMVTVGKEIEVLIQRLSQKSRAAGIHLIMATQRPSVDVITGVIKANLPTRISFAVTSRIDSRTILGEQGAEQLLGKGDMLYKPSSDPVKRVHGPFVSDEEVEMIADFWRGQGSPEYVDSVTEEPEDGGFGFDDLDATASDNPDERKYRQACQIVFESQKASASWLQRQLGVGYNTAAKWVERMEADGFVGPANHVGRREIYRDKDGQPL